ncbi:flagellar basal-body rod protein FlgF [Rhizobium sp. L1K21]|uniref:flagellar basal-body rod protein FlgF n=1 Tax=Rhizobium sp. L1K21 TaxID=2954933 RepID=UPI002093BECB|nr:flagellar basal-body rod protein FlgF [Rhizobium sp. L1K21]MCO6187131.1 flagellar basal-body rod protein FlgF [Rhizobium sp. L1K21]
METGIYVALSSQIALEKRLTTIADNVANTNTVGFRSTEVKFDEALSKAGDTSVKGDGDVAFVTEGAEYLSTKNGGLTRTGNPLDFAIRGDAWFSIQTPVGQALTRDGRFTITATGQLVSVEGYPILDSGGAPISVSTQGGELTVSRDGLLQEDGRPIAAIGLFNSDFQQGFYRAGSSAVIPTAGISAVVNRTEAGIVQGYVEESNVNPVSEMTRLIMVQRYFENMQALLGKSESSLEQAIKTLGGA